MEPKPFAPGVERHQEHRFPLQFFEHQLRVGFARQMVHQIAAHLIKHRDVEQQLPASFRLGLQDLFTEVVGDQPVVPAELGDKRLRIGMEPERDTGQLQSSGPALGAVDQNGHALLRQGPAGDVLEQLRRLRLIQGQVNLPELGQISSNPVAGEGHRRVNPRRKHQVDLGREQVDQAAQIRHQDAVGQVVQVVEDDDHLGELGHLRVECFEQGGPQPTAIHGHEWREFGHVGVDLSQRPQQALGEADGVIVDFLERQPHEVQFGVGGGPLAQQDGFARTGRSHQDDQGPREGLVQSADQTRTGHLMGWCSGHLHESACFLPPGTAPSVPPGRTWRQPRCDSPVTGSSGLD